MKIKDKIVGHISHIEYEIVKKLGEGGQGTVYLIKSDNTTKALKWYNSAQSTEEQKKSILELIQKGNPKKDVFIWMEDLVVQGQQFGYIMPVIDFSTYAQLGEVQTRSKPAPDFKTICVIASNLVEAFRTIHLSGYCYRDISKGNFVFNPQTGDILICDNDNVGIAGISEAQVLGTMEYMAPELVSSQTSPSTKTDLHSLAVLLFDLWMWHHPFHGSVYEHFQCWDIMSKKIVYGSKAIFIFDPKNNQNALPQDSDYDGVRKRWELCPDILKQKFTTAFVDGVTNPDKRITEGEWLKVFNEISDRLFECSNDGAELIWCENKTEYFCWHCKSKVEDPVKLKLDSGRGIRYIVLNANKTIKDHMGNPLCTVVQNPNNPKQWGIKNLTQVVWKYKTPDGLEKEALPNKSIPLVRNFKIEFSPTSKGEFI